MPRRSDAVVTANEVFVAARKRLRSPLRPGQCISRAELAEAVNRTLDSMYPDRDLTSLYVDFRWVGKLERGESRWPVEERRAALRELFGVSNDFDLDLYSPRRTESISAERQDAVACLLPVSGFKPSDTTETDRRSPDAASSTRGTSRTYSFARRRRTSSTGINRRRVVAGLATPAIAALIGAVVAPFGRDESASGSHQVELEALTAEVSRVRWAYQQSRYSVAAAALPDLMAGLRRVRSGTQDRVVARLEGEAYQVASGLLLKGDEPILAAIAAERCTAAAERADDDLAIACGARAVVHCLLADGHAQQGVGLAVTAADRLSKRVDMDDPAALSVYGALLLRGAIAAGQRQDREQAHTLLDEAARAATRLGADRNLCWTAFGPANVGAHRVAVAVELGDAGSAVAHARKIEMVQLQLPERKAMVLLDTARALTQWGKWDRAFAAVQEAEKQAPEEVRSRPAVHQMIDDLAQRSPPSLQGSILEYAEHVSANL